MSDDMTFRKASELFRSVCKCLTLTFFFVLLVACQSSAPPTAPDNRVTEVATQATVVDTPSASTSVPFAFDWDDRAPFQAGLVFDERATLDQLAGASVYHIDLQIADDLVHLEGRQAVRYTNQEAEPLNEVYFRLFPNLFGGATEVQAVQANGGDVAPTYGWGNSVMRVPLSPALQPGQQAVIQMAFSVQVPTEGGDDYGIFAFIDDVLALAHFYPMIPVYDDEGWNLEIPPKTGDVVYADSSFFVVQVTAPADLTVVASGVEIARQARDNQQQVTFAGGPMRDFYLVASRQYTAVSKQVGGTKVNSYVLPKFVDEAEIVLGHAEDALKAFGARFGGYPFTEFDVVSTPTQALGVEYPGIVAVALRLYDLETGEYPPVYLESTVAHEVGHQWFYSVVGNDQLDEPWLDEALTQYATLLYWGDLYGTPGADGFRSSLYERWGRVEEAQIPIGLPVRAYNGQEYSAIVYGRGPLFFEALAEEMGQQAFDAFLRDYYAAHKWGIATTEGLKQLAEQHCGCDLTLLFAEWVYEQ